ncbi:MAG: SH3 domain-containing protein [Chloroflexi bacterium]|nr:SH3 domain-containing protein [Chloroflexota bacterium]MCC6892789.1 SH3 domain-containing protein [Anaerolineae bacterium]
MNKKRASVFSLILLVVVLVFSSTFSAIQAQDFGTNWSATFFPTNNLTGTGVPVSNIQGLNFNWGTGQPVINGVAVPGIPADNFSARFTSVQTFLGGTYTFTAVSDDGMRVYVDGALLLDKFIGRVATTDTFSAQLTAGPHTLTVEYFEGIDQALIQLQWGLTGGIVTAGPSPTPGPTNTPAPTSLPAIPSGALTATVIRAPVLNVRGGPSAFADRIGSVLRGQTYQVVGRDENARWFLLQLSGKQGWALGYYLYFNTNEFNAPVVSDFVLGGNPAAVSGVVAQSVGTLRLRAAPDVRSQQIGRVTWGGAVAVIGRTGLGDWYQVIWKGTTGWVASAWVRVVEGDINSVPIVQ